MQSKKCEDDALGIIHLFLNNNQDKKSTMKGLDDDVLKLQRVLKLHPDTAKVCYSKKSGS